MLDSDAPPTVVKPKASGVSLCWAHGHAQGKGPYQTGKTDFYHRRIFMRVACC